jgi:hypothetical protein
MKTVSLLLVLSAPAFFAQLRPGQTEKLPPEIAPPGFTFRDILTVDRIHYRKDLQNDQLRVLHLNLKGDESVPLHDANDGLFVCLKECHLRLADPGGHIQDIHLGNGQSRWIGAGTRTEKNLSTQPVEMLFIETRRRN